MKPLIDNFLKDKPPVKKNGNVDANNVKDSEGINEELKELKNKLKLLNKEGTKIEKNIS
jgi:hypothetical protein